MASLWIRSGCDMKVDPSVETYQVGAHFKALIKAILAATSRILENCFVSGLVKDTSTFKKSKHKSESQGTIKCLSL